MVPVARRVYEWHLNTYRIITKRHPRHRPPPVLQSISILSLSHKKKVYRIGGGGGGWWRLCNFWVSFPFELPPPLCNLRRWRRWRRWRLGFSGIEYKFYMKHIYLYKILPSEGVPTLGLYSPLISLCAFVLSLTVLLCL